MYPPDGSSRTIRSITTMQKSKEEEKKQAEEEEEPVYTLREHCQFLSLKTETTTTTSKAASQKSKTVWYCDWTKYFCPKSHQLLEDVVQDYCQPQLLSLSEEHVGISSIQSSSSDATIPPVRTISLQLRPDTKESKIWTAVHEAFRAVHPKHSLILKKYDNNNSKQQTTFQAIGADGNVPLFLAVDIATQSQEPWQRRLWIRIYHANQYPVLMEEDLQKIGGISNKKSLLQNTHTPWNVQLTEASGLVQYVLQKQLSPNCACPKETEKATSEYFQKNYTKSSGVQKTASKTRVSFPSLSPEDFPVLQESVPLIERIWSELELQNCTWNTMTRETKRFGMCGQPTLDKEYCQQLARVSQQSMLLQVQSEVERAEQVLHETLSSLHQVQEFIVTTMRNEYRVDVCDVVDVSATTTDGATAGVEYGQTPVALPKRDAAEFPWHPSVRNALDEISHRVADGCLKEFDPRISIAMAIDGVHNVMQGLSQADDVDQQAFLRQRNRQAMIRLRQQQIPVSRLISEVLPQQCQVAKKMSGSVGEKLRTAVQRVEALSTVDGETEKWKVNQVPLVEFATPRGGCVILTPQSLVIAIKPLVGALQKQTLPLTDVDILLTPDNLLSKVTIKRSNGSIAAKVNPASPVDLKRWVQLIEVLKGLQ